MEPLERWKDRPPAAGDREARAAALVRRIRPLGPPDDAEVDRLLERLQVEVPGGAGPSAVGAFLQQRWRLWAAGLSILLGLNVALGAAVIYGRRRDAAPVSPLVIGPPLPAAVPAAVPTPVPEVRVEAPAPHGRPAPRSASQEDSLAQESALVGEALRSLAAGKAEAALAAAGSYLQRYPAGALRGEAEIARLEALLALGRREEAGRLLDGFAQRDFAALPRSDELRVVRGELLLEQGRFAEALASFEAPGADATPALRERALYGRALCHARLGDPEGSRRDFARYLEGFPQGRHAAEAREALRGAPAATAKAPL
ncbi:MAG: tetratricopeptide repeat protein [Myxococcales bacterium]